MGLSKVALLAEGVDRNQLKSPRVVLPVVSPSSRRAWIEILFDVSTYMGLSKVALLAEGVDRNHLLAVGAAGSMCRPPRGGRG